MFLTLSLATAVAGFAIGSLNADFYLAVYLTFGVIATLTICLLLMKSGQAESLSLLSPWIIFPVAFIFYFSVGSSNTGVFLGTYVGISQWGIYFFALVFFFLGVGIAVSREKASKQQVMQETCIDGVPGMYRVRKLRSIIFIVGILLLGYSTVLAGIPVLGAVDAIRFNYSSPLGYFWPYVLRLVSSAAILSIAIHYCDRSLSTSQKWVNLLMGLFAAFAVSLFGSRSFLVPVFMTLVVCRHFYKKSLTIKMATLLAIFLFLGLSLFGLFRMSSAGSLDVAFEAFQLLGLPPSLASLGPGYLSILNGPHVLAQTLSQVPEGVPFQLGRIFLGEIITIAPGQQQLPDQWVAEKIIHTVTVQAAGYKSHAMQSGGIPPTILGGLYIDFGFLGIAVGMFLSGWFLAYFYILTNRRRSVFHTAMYSLILSFFLVSIYGFLIIKLADVWQMIIIGFILREQRHFLSLIQRPTVN